MDRSDKELTFLKKATFHFLEKGFKTLTMDDLACVMGISKKTIYSLYKNKTDLVDSVSEYILDSIEQGIEEIVSQQLNPIEEYFSINDFVSKSLRKEFPASIYQLEKYYPAIFKKKSERKFTMVSRCLQRNLKAGIEGGWYRPDLDVDFMSRLYFLIVHGLKNQELFPLAQFPNESIMLQFLEYHIRGIVTPEGLTILEHIKLTRNI